MKTIKILCFFLFIYNLGYSQEACSVNPGGPRTICTDQLTILLFGV